MRDCTACVRACVCVCWWCVCVCVVGVGVVGVRAMEARRGRSHVLSLVSDSRYEMTAITTTAPVAPTGFPISVKK